LPLLEVHNVTKKFGSLIANHDVSFDIEEGQIVGLIGPNGAGKTTLFNCISGLYKINEGKVLFNGIDITEFPPYKVAKLGTVRTFQIVHPLKDMTVFDNVLIRNKRAGDLTIGLKKRLELARALATGPKLLMLDESMAGLTSTEVKESVELVKNLRDTGITFLIVEHVMEAIMPIADKVVVLDGGVKIAEGKPQEIIKNEQVIEAYFGKKYSKKFQAAKGGREKCLK